MFSFNKLFFNQIVEIWLRLLIHTRTDSCEHDMLSCSHECAVWLFFILLLLLSTGVKKRTLFSVLLSTINLCNFIPDFTANLSFYMWFCVVLWMLLFSMRTDQLVSFVLNRCDPKFRNKMYIPIFINIL